MTSKNDITGDEIKSRSSSKEFRDNWDKIFKKPSKEDLDKAKQEFLEALKEESERTGRDLEELKDKYGL